MTKRSLAAKVAALEALRNQRDALDAEIKSVQATLIEHLDSHETKSLTVEVEDRPITITKVQAVRTEIDAAQLHEMLDKGAWLKVTTRVLDKKKLEAHIASGEVDPMVVAECAKEIANSPYIKLS